MSREHDGVHELPELLSQDVLDEGAIDSALRSLAEDAWTESGADGIEVEQVWYRRIKVSHYSKSSVLAFGDLQVEC